MAVRLETRIWGWCAGITLGALLVFFLIADGSFRSTIRSGVEQNVRSASVLAAQVRASQFDALMRRTAHFAGDPTLKGTVDTADPATIEQALRAELSRGALDWLAVVSLDGTLLASTDGVPPEELGRADVLLGDARYYDTGDVWARGERVLDVAASPILFGTVPIAILVAGRALDGDAVGEIETYVQQRVVVVSAGRVVVGEGWDGADDASLRVIAGATGPREFRAAGEDLVGMESPIQDAAGDTVASLLTYGSLDAALAPARRLRLGLVEVALVASGFAFFLALLLARRVTAPVSLLLDEARRLGEGDLDRPILPMRRDEIGKLAEGFDQMRSSLRAAQTELIRSERLSALGQMASSIVHDFSNPLAAIRMNAELLGLESNGMEPPVETREIVAQVDTLDAMLREVLEFARGERRLDKRPIDVGGWIMEVERFWAPLLARDGIDLTVRAEHGEVWAFDPERLRRVVDNLIKNARGAVAPGGTIELRAAGVAERLRLEVTDDGRGIPPELHDSLFQPFTTSGKKDGTGLGLAICRSVVERHGGSIRFASSPSGTTFTIEIPGGEEMACVGVA